MQYSDEHLRYLRLLSQKYQTVAAAASEIIRIEALLRLPKGTEHFMSDLHGEHEAFVHILNSASGVIREKIDTVLGNGVPAEERAELATLVYYPNQKLPELKARQRDLHAWYRMTLLRLIDLCRFVSSKHTRDHVRRCLPQNCGYILDELLHAHFEDHDKDQYYGEIIESIIRYDRADAYIIRFCEVIKRLAVDRLHIVGDLFDRGPRPDRILDSLMAHHQVDIQWGNHDVVWMGAAAGSPLCIMTVLKTTLALQQSGHAGGRLRHQPAPLGALCPAYLRGFRCFALAAPRRPAHSGRRPDRRRADAQGRDHYDAQAGGAGHCPQPGF